MRKRRNQASGWRKARLPYVETEQAEPRDHKATIYPSDIATTRALSGPVKTWADMTPGERSEVLKKLKGRK